MFWRLFRRRDLEKFREEDCWAIVEFDDSNPGSTHNAISNSIASELLCKGFNVLLVGRALEHVQKSLASSHPERRIAVISNEHVEGDNSSEIYVNSLKSLTSTTTLVVLCSAEPAYAARISNAEGSVGGPNSTLRLLRIVLPNLKTNRPTAVVVVGGPLSFYSAEYVQRLDYYEAFISTLTREVRDLKLDSVEFLYVDCHSTSSSKERGRATLMNPSSDSYAKSVLKSVGCGHSHLVPYWPHEFLAWVLWILLFIFPRSTLRNIEHRLGL